MGIQLDVESLSIQALENYAKTHNLSEEEAVDLFYEHQIFEKIILQHEMLHQLDISETFIFVEESISEDSSPLILYHGSNVEFDSVDLQKSHNHRDFGRGFYCTILEVQAREWAHRLYMRKYSGGEYVYKYVFCPGEQLKIKHFTGLDVEWLEFVKKNRIYGGTQHEYDVVIGPVADDNTMETVQLYMAGILKAEEAVERLRYSKVNNQVSFHTPLSLQYLHFEGRKES